MHFAPDIVDKLVDLHKQATTERSHFYVASTVKEAIDEIIALRLKIGALQRDLTNK
jgi:hypothetical protein